MLAVITTNIFSWLIISSHLWNSNSVLTVGRNSHTGGRSVLSSTFRWPALASTLPPPTKRQGDAGLKTQRKVQKTQRKVPLQPGPCTENIRRLLQLPQSQRNKLLIENEIEALKLIAEKSPRLYRLPVTGSSSWRTLWSTSTASSPAGTLLRQRPSNILGGESWQVFDESMTRTENVVYWNALNLRMVGKANIQAATSTESSRTAAGFSALANMALSRNGSKFQGTLRGATVYSLAIKGLEFRWGLPPVTKSSPRNLPQSNETAAAPALVSCVPEAGGALGDVAVQADRGGRSWKVFSLSEDITLSNGVGKLDLVYNDGALRVSSDAAQGLTYIHLREGA